MKKIILVSVLAFFLSHPSFSQQEETHVRIVSPGSHSSDVFYSQDSLSHADLQAIIRKFEKHEGIQHFNPDSMLQDKNNLITGLIQPENQYRMPVVKPQGDFYIYNLKQDSSNLYYLIIKDPLKNDRYSLIQEP